MATTIKDAWSLVGWDIGPAVTDGGEAVVALVPKLCPPGSNTPHAQPPFVLTREAAERLAEHLRHNLALLEAMSAKGRPN